MNSIKIKCPAKINLTLEVLNKRTDGFHNIKSVMQMVSLYDYLTIKTEHAGKNEIKLSGTSAEIPYNEKNLVYKAAELYLKHAGLSDVSIEVYIEKHIPISAGLAGGSTDAAGTIFGLNKIFNKYNDIELEKMCMELGSDLNVCLKGGCVLATSRGEITEKIKCIDSDVTLIKPKQLGISAKEAYTKYSEKTLKPQYNMTEKMINAINSGSNINQFLYNDLEYAVFEDYKELQAIKKAYPNSVMSGSGSTYFILDNVLNNKLGNEYEFINNLKFIDNGVSL